MITGTEMYWLTRLTGIHNGLCGVGIVLMLIGAVGLVIGALIWHEDEVKKWFFISFGVSILGLIIAFSSIFVPTTKEMCAIKVIPTIVNNEQVQEMPDKIMDLANEWITELSPNKDSN